MFCAYCGKPIIEDARFCPHCGKSVTPTSPATAVNEWEYTYFRATWKKGGRFPLTFGTTEYGVRLDNWGSDQNWIMPQLQQYLDKGWTPVSQIGPGAYMFWSREEYTAGIKFTVLSVHQFLVELRRPATPLSDSEEQLLGRWEETKDPNKGFLNKLDNVLVWQKPEIQKWRYEFKKDRTFFRVGPGGDKLDGVYVRSSGNEFKLMFKLSAVDHSATLHGNRLIIKRESNVLGAFERSDK